MVADQLKSSCSFCGRDQSALFILVVGPLGNICDECVDICSDILSEKRSGVEPAVTSTPSPTFACGLCGQLVPSVHGDARAFALSPVNSQALGRPGVDGGGNERNKMKRRGSSAEAGRRGGA